MPTEEATVQRVSLENGLAIEIRDESVRVAADRWQVRCVARVEVPTSRWTEASDVGDPSPDEVRAVLGDAVTFDQRRERTFVGAGERDRVFGALRDEILETARTYVARPQFPVRLIRRRYRDAVRERELRARMKR